MGDSAFAISYLQILVPTGWVRSSRSPITVRRAVSTRVVFRANRWEFVRTAKGWKINRRTLRALDGTLPAREILAGALEP
jgi:hypothetical protein